MEQIIQRLVEFDKRGREVVREARLRRGDVLAHMDDDKREMAARLLERSDSRVETVREQSIAERDERLAEVRRQFDEQSARLRANYEKNSDRWVGMIVDRCLGR